MPDHPRTNVHPRIAVLSDGIPPYVMGGMQKHSRLFVEYVAKTGAQVVLYHVIHGVELPKEEEVLSHFSPSQRERISARTFSYPDEDRWPGHYLRVQRRLSRIYFESLCNEEQSFDLVFCKGFMAWEVSKHKDLIPGQPPVAVKFHGMNMFQTQPDLKGEITKWMLRKPVRSIMNNCDWVFSYGGKITDIIRDEVKDPDKVVELPSGLDEDWLTPKERPTRQEAGIKRYLFVGRYDRLKGLPELYKAWKEIERNDISLTLVGPIPEQERMNDPRLHYIGPIHDSEELKRIYDAHDILICPSISEGMPNVILEAMARRLSVIGTDVGATSILVDHSTGWLIEKRNHEQLKSAIEEAASDTDLERKQENGFQRVANDYNWKHISEAFRAWMTKNI